jgi:hypothetical protein
MGNTETNRETRGGRRLEEQEDGGAKQLESERDSEREAKGSLEMKL